MTATTETAEGEALALFGAAMAVSNAFSRSGTEVASASSATSVTAAGATSHATNDATGAMLIANTAADWSGTTLYGNVQSNTSGTAPVYTVDRWYTMAGVVSASSPSTTGPFVITPCMSPFWFAALTDSVSAVGAGDKGTALGGTEFTTNGLARQKITTVTRTAAGAGDMALSTVFTYTGSTDVAIGRAALVNSTVNAKGFAKVVDQINAGTAAHVSQNGDTFTPTWTIDLTP